MENFVQALIVSFREGLEAFLIIAIILKFLDKTDNKILKKNVWHGVGIGIIASFILGLILLGISNYLGGTGSVAKLWESGASLVAVILITTFIIWMVRHGNTIKTHVENRAALNLSAKGILLLAFIMVVREGAEIAIFAFAGQYAALPIFIGITTSILLAFLIYKSLVKIKLTTIFTITLAYLILQAGFLFGYSVHEGLSAAKSLEMISAEHPIYTKAFDLSKTVLYHKEGIVGVPLYVSVGWYSKPEWIQAILHYGYVLLFFLYWHKFSKKKEVSA